MKPISRTSLRASLAGLSLAGVMAAAPGVAQAEDLTLWSHVVHKQVVEGERGGAEVNLGMQFTEATGDSLTWSTIAFDQMQDKILREINLPRSEANIVFILNTWAAPNVLAKLAPLDAFMAADPIADMEDLAPAMVDAYTDGEGVKGIPIRHNPQLLHYNRAIFEAQGIDGEPATIEEFMADAKAATFKREDGAQVYGFAFETNQAEDLVVLIRAYGGEVLTKDLDIRVNEPEAVAAISALRDLFEAGALPANLAILKPADLQNLMSQGLIAMGIFGDNYYDRFADPEQSQVAGDTWFAPVPASEGNDMADYASSAGFWSMAIPKNSDEAAREDAYRFIAFLAAPDNQLTLALNNNSPVRASIYSNPEYADGVPYSDVVQKVLPIAAPPFPAFPGSKDAEGIFLEQAVSAITGQKDVQQAMDDAASGIERVLKREGLR